MKRLILILLAVFVALVVLVVIAALVLGPSLGLERRVDFDAPGILVIELDGLVVERAAPDLFSAEFEGAQHELLDLALALDRAATDDRVAGVYLRVGTPGYGWAKAEELRARLAAFRARGKFVYAFTTWTDELGYYVASAADSIYLLPDGMLDLNGFRAETPFIRPLLEKLGLEPQVEAIGAYKSAADMLRRDNMSDAEREVTGAILGERYGRFLDAATAGRRVDRARFAAALDQGVYLARDLEALQLVDGQRYEADVRRLAVARARGVEPGAMDDADDLDASFVDVRDYAAELPDPPGDVEGTVGLVYAVGAITGGDSGFDPVFGRTLGARSTIEMLENVARDDAL
ncbi:MAG: S49 family peptidase, partial [Gemmatimonadota bacterium]